MIVNNGREDNESNFNFYHDESKDNCEESKKMELDSEVSSLSCPVKSKKIDSNISVELKNKMLYEPFPILKKQLSNCVSSNSNKSLKLSGQESVQQTLLLQKTETESKFQKLDLSISEKSSLCDKIDFSENKNHSEISISLESEQQEKDPFNVISDEPMNLSSKSYSEENVNDSENIEKKGNFCNISNENTITKEMGDTEYNKNNDNKEDNNRNKNFSDSDDANSDIENDRLNTEQQQQLILAHLSKLQQHFVSNILQFQANFLAHYQQIQQHLMLQSGDSNNENCAQDDEAPNSNLQESSCSDSEEERKDKSAALIPPPLIPVALLGNLVPYALYQRLLPAITSEDSPSPNHLQNSLDFLNKEGDKDVNSDDESNSPPCLPISASLFQHLIKKSDELQSKSKNNSELTSSKKYSILSALIGASNPKDNFSSVEKKEEEEASEETGNSGFQFKRKRIAFSAKQYEILQTTFEHNNFPEPGDQQCIARQLKAPYRSIKMWFQNKRANARKKLFPGEKGSGRTTTGEKIPGDTDTRFYCDKCPSAFICQKYLRNHLDAHKVYTKICPKCRVAFTHDCLLNTHLISKCGKKEEKKQLKNEIEEKAERRVKKEEADDDREEEDKFLRINGFHGARSLFGKNKEEKLGLNSNILDHLNSSLPLLTLLQIQKTRSEQNNSEQYEEQSRHSSEEEEQMSEEDQENNISEQETKEKDYNDDSVENKVIKKEIPALIPTEFVKPSVNNITKFAILRQLLTNYHQKSLNENDNFKNYDCEQATDLSNKAPKIPAGTTTTLVPTTSTTTTITTTSIKEEKENYDSEADFKPKNIPEYLHSLLKDNQYKYSSDLEKTDTGYQIGEQLNNEDIDENYADSIYETEENEKQNAESVDDENDEKGYNKTNTNNASKPKRLRRRTTVFTENQHRVLYLHFTHCNFPDPSMFRILSKLTGLTPHVIKIWFQNERSRQRRQVNNLEGEITREKKPYKCRDCGVEFAMPAFLVKHCMRHIPTENVTSQARKCPICMIEFETQKLHSHFMASHNLSINIEEEGANEENICHLCKEHFSDLNSLSIHKNEHLKDTQYGDPPQCNECKTTFVNVLCLEAHMATHYKFKWDHSCPKCKMRFYDKILLESHLISHSMNSMSGSHVKSPSNNYSTQSEQSNNCQYLISLIQKIADSENEKKVKDNEEGDIKTSGEKIESVDKDPSEKCKTANNNVTDSLQQGKPIPNISLKFIPVKFIPVTPSTHSQSSAVNTSASPVVTVIPSTFISPGINNNPVTVKSTQGPINLSNSANILTPSNLSFTVKEEVKSSDSISVLSSPVKKQVPNLIPISKARLQFKVQESDEACKKNTAKEGDTMGASSDENESKEYDDSHDLPFPLPEETHDSQVLVYTPYASEYRKRRRTPTHFNSSQRDILEAYYKYDNFPDPNEQLHLSEYLKVPYSVIKTWYQNTRKNHRKHLKESLNFEVGGPFECLDCRVCFVSKIYLESHIREHKEEQPFSCTLCLKQFPHQAVFDIHQRMGCSKKSKKKHEQIRPFSSLTRTFKLSESGEDFSKESKYSTSNTLYSMPLSRKRKLSNSSEDKSNVKCFKFEHVNVLEGGSEIEPVQNVLNNLLDACSENDAIESSLNDAGNHQCLKCHMSFSSSKLLLEHNCPSVLAPSQVVGYKCPQCDETFQSILSVAEHREKYCKKLPFIQPTKHSLTREKPSLHQSEFIELYPPSLDSDSTKEDKKVSLTVKIKEKIGFTRANICFLQVHYKHNNFPTVKEMESISKRLGIDKEKVEHWFLKQRARERKGQKHGNAKSLHGCKSCSSYFVHQDALLNHQKTVHNPSAISIEFVCPQQHCTAKYPNATLLQTHQMEHAEEKSVDGKKGQNLRHHSLLLEMHYKENNFPSSVLINAIAQKIRIDHVDVHWWFKQRREKNLHGYENDVSRSEGCVGVAEASSASSGTCKTTETKDCSVCSASFLTEEFLKSHLDVHFTNYALVCWECGCDFSSPLVLKTHLSQHNNLTVPNDLLSASKMLSVNSSVEMKYTFIQMQ
ncbi:hypothetical protein Anas_10258, partial [Armadillidium nasatum]